MWDAIRDHPPKVNTMRLIDFSQNTFQNDWLIAKAIRSFVYPVSAVVIAMLSSKSVVKPRSELLYAGQNQHRRGISFNNIDTFHCSKRLSIVGAFRIESPYDIYRNHPNIFSGYPHVISRFLKVLLVFWWYPKLIHHCFLCLKILHHHLRVLCVFARCSYRLSPHLEPNRLPF